ncbi:MAG: hypothetical protein GOVbin631_11 [Prokaryotic dsDNA virus sp.]|nr:MAG: hypothetical protein GOVbin631_11 [Prokaryotic dsDNA virus sp.]|tara:strand:- start:375 stop:587 length:213 start_codon:yes stop_codon:yes gene_type:complete
MKQIEITQRVIDETESLTYSIAEAVNQLRTLHAEQKSDKSFDALEDMMEAETAADDLLCLLDILQEKLKA